MHLASLVFRPFTRSPKPLVLALTVALLALEHSTSAATISSRVLIDPVGENNADFFGTSVAWVGDVNGDGYDDLLIGAFRYPEIGSVGQAYLYFGGPAIDLVADLVIPAPPGGAGWFGISVASAGDFNGDGYRDFIIGAQQSGNEGKAFVYYGGPSLDATPDVTLIGESTGSLTAFGASVALAGDVNEDGFDDVIVGAPQSQSSGNRPGRAYVFFGGAVPDAVPDRVFNGVGFNDQLGSAVGSAGDMNGDGHPDVFASAPGSSVGALGAGAIYVWFGGPAFDTTPDLTLLGSGAHERLMNAANAGDVNGDGFSDLIGAGSGQVRVWFGGSFPNSIPDLTLARRYASVAGSGDVNGDGIDDFVVGSEYDPSGGRVSVFFGGSAADTLGDLYYAADDPGAAIGLCVAGGGHVDGPGPPDLIASANCDPDAIGYNRGRVYVIANSLDPTAVPVTATSGVSFVGAQPNPARNQVNFALALDHAASVRITVYDLAGRVVARPVQGERLAGRVTRTWNPGALPRGVYYVSTRLDDREQVRKLIWLGQSR
jgi:hypothetical protein